MRRHAVPVRAVAGGFVGVAACLSVAAVMAAAVGGPEPGVYTDERGRMVVDVFPGGPAWRYGIRPGHPIDALSGADTRAGWGVVVRSPLGPIHAHVAGMTVALRETLPVAALAMGALAFAVLLFRRYAAISAALAAVGCVLASFPVMIAGQPLPSSLAAPAALLAPALWLSVYAPVARHARVTIATVAVAIAGVWLAARFALPDAFDVADTVRLAGVGLGSLVMLGAALDIRRWVTRLTVLDLRATADLLALVVLAGLATLLLSIGVAPVAVAAGGVGLLLVYPRWRKVTGGLFDRMLLGDVRAQASLRAAEDERGRLARELHDAPLQDLAAVIRRLDEHPGVGGETDTLRRVAAQLRGVTTQLRPPVLEDLGLAPALAFLVDQANTAPDGPRVAIELTHEPALTRDERAPADVEVAIFRIAQEAVKNAQLHSGAAGVLVTAAIDRDAVEVTVADEGMGLDATAVEDAQRRGRLGLHSMRQRAAAIGARLTVEGNDRGTRVAVSWVRE